MNMKTRIITIAILISLLCALDVKAQQEPMITQYQSNQLFVNPAYAGSHDYTTVSALYRKQWVDFPSAPTTAFLTYDNHFQYTNIGAGLTFVHDEIGPSNRSDLSGIFAYHIPTGNTGHLSLALKGSIGFYSAHLTDLKIWDKNDQIFARDVLNKWIPNFGAGAYYYTQKFYAGISVPSLINYSRPSQNVAADIYATPSYQRHYFATLGYVIAFPSNVYLKPSTLIKYIPDAPAEADVNLNVFFLNRFNIGAGYRTRDGLVAMAEMSVTRNLRIGYAYDYPFTDINMFTSATHEIMLAYDFLRDNTKIKTPRFF
jgi:type IX secretion system PorP/SprF family membrane protein